MPAQIPDGARGNSLEIDTLQCKTNILFPRLSPLFSCLTNLCLGQAKTSGLIIDPKSSLIDLVIASSHVSVAA